MAWFAAAAPYITAGTTALSVYSQAEQGRAAAANANLVAAQQDRAANQAQVEAQQEAANERKRAKLVRSRALAVAGASGAGVSDPTVTNILTDIDTEGEVNALNALYSGDYSARAIRSGADATRREGRARKSAGYVAAGTTALNWAGSSQGQSFFEKYS